ncbi:Hypp6172 [Branchiostoma lanceolatum]|uniref:Hypp6172 protein n=1 Tax=Branchiostoma lanceolatum TaxID=7740 RepID=A0A8J9YNR2_BRALA|nr:Hypp6172 [Branchiostoma lanceolatum]
MSNRSTLKAINLEQYEVSSCESLHNAKEHMKNLLEELPNHVNPQDKASIMEVQSAFQGKEVMRGSDFRKLLISVTAHLVANGGDPKVVELLNTPCEVVHICYLGEDERLINLKSVNAEHQEKLFNSLRGILCNTTSRRPEKKQPSYSPNPVEQPSDSPNPVEQPSNSSNPVEQPSDSPNPVEQPSDSPNPVE